METGQHHKQWGVADFERYHSGKMPEAEMHALEKAALDDPFLEDALEGYAFTKTPVADINDLKENIWPSTTDVKTPVVWFKRNAVSQLFKAAAVLIIFGGLGWLIFDKTRSKPEEQVPSAIASNEKIQAGDDSVASLYNLNDSAPVIAKLDQDKVDAIIKQTSPTVVQEPGKDAPYNYDVNLPAEKDDIARNESRAKEKEYIVAAPSQANKPAAPRAITQDAAKTEAEVTLKRQATAADNNQVRGRVVDTDGNPVPFATVRNNADRRQSVAADAQGNFALTQNAQTSNSNIVPVEVNAAGYQQVTTTVDNNKANNTIVLNQADNALEEVVVSGNDKNGKKEKYQWNGKNSRIQLTNAVPLEGWPYFYYVMNDSIVNNKQLNRQKGKIVLSFDTDSNGAVKNVVVTKSLNDTADDAARRMLYKSPVLNIKNSKIKGEATIKTGL